MKSWPYAFLLGMWEFRIGEQVMTADEVDLILQLILLVFAVNLLVWAIVKTPEDPID